MSSFPLVKELREATRGLVTLADGERGVWGGTVATAAGPTLFFCPGADRSQGGAVLQRSQRKPQQSSTMVGKFMVLADVPDQYTTKQGKMVKSQILTLVDRDERADCRLKTMVDYTLSESEKEQFAGKLVDKTIVMAFTEPSVFGGRFRMRGRILEVDGKPVNGAPVSEGKK